MKILAELVLYDYIFIHPKYDRQTGKQEGLMIGFSRLMSKLGINRHESFIVSTRKLKNSICIELNSRNYKKWKDDWIYLVQPDISNYDKAAVLCRNGVKEVFGKIPSKLYIRKDV
jgi:hypothetical protein